MSSQPLPNTADCWFLTGPTASGKSAIAIHLAQRLGAEIVSLDSMALYRGMDIGTAKPSLEERRQVSHHLIDILDPGEEFSLAQYVAVAERAVAEIRARLAVPLFVGGTALYLKALLRGIFVGPPADWDLRHRWQQFAATHGEEALHARLAEVDAESARRLHARDTRRVIRALEVWETAGIPISQLQQQFERARAAEDCRVFVVDRPREELRTRIDRRVERMFERGLLSEVQSILEQTTALSRTATQALGYREAIEHLRGVRDLAATVDLVKLRTRQFSKRQMTWFRSLSECRFVPVVDSDSPAELARRLIDT